MSSSDDKAAFESTILAPDSPASQTMPPGTEPLNDRYRLIRELGHGGMAVVYLAEDVETGRQVAVKMMNARMTGTAKQRFTREFSTIASVKHPHCLDVYEYGESDAGPFFAMELFEGQPATALIGQPRDIILKAIYEVAEAIEFVHSRRIIHRDIKPGNILVRETLDGSDFEVKLADFGLAKFANTSSSMSGDTNFLGTVAYCAPEQIMREDLDQRADLYSFGIVCYELLTGHHPYESSRRNIQSLVAKHLRETPRSPRELEVELPRDVDRAIMEMLAKEAAERPSSTQTLRTAIARHLGWDEAVAEEPEEPQRLQRLAAAFVSREQEQQTIDALLSETLNPTLKQIERWREVVPPSALLLTGEAGIGKSRLMRQAARSALVEGAHIYEGRCFEGNLAPFQPFVEIVRQLLLEQENFRRKADSSDEDDVLASTTLLQASDPTGRIDLVLQDFAPELRRIGPDLRHLLSGKAFDQTHIAPESDYIFRAVASFFVKVAQIQPTCLLMEDLHWADQATLTLLRHLTTSLETVRREAAEKHLTPPRLFLCGTCRVGGEYAATVEFIDSLVGSRQLGLRPFEPTELRELIASVLGALPTELDEQIVLEVHRNCLGNPFYISQAVNEWRLQGQLRWIGDKWTLSRVDDNTATSLPSTVRESLAKRIQQLPKLSGQLLSVSAVIGAVVNVDLLRAALPEPGEFEFLDALDDLLGRNILQETGQAKRVTFTHDLLREVALEKLTQSRLQAINQTVGQILERRAQSGENVGLARLAEHFRAAGDVEKSFNYFLQAGTQALTAFARDDAIRLLEKARALTPQTASQQDRFHVAKLLGEAHLGTQQPDRAVPFYEESLELGTAPNDRAGALLGLARLAHRARNAEQATDLIQRGLAELGFGSHQSILRVVFDICFGTFYTFVLPAPLRRITFRKRTPEEEDTAFRLTFYQEHVYVDVNPFRCLQYSHLLFMRSHRTNDPAILSVAYSKHGTILACFGTPIVPLRMTRQAAGYAELVDDLESSANAEGYLGMVMGMRGDLQVAVNHMEKSLQLYERIGESESRIMIAHMLRHWWEHLGDPIRELKWAREELRMATLLNDWEKMAWGHYGCANSLARAGGFDAAHEEMQQSLALIGDHHSVLARAIALVTYGFVLLQRSEYEKALAILLECRDTAERNFTICELTARAYSLAVEAMLGPHWHDGQTRKRPLSPFLTRPLG